MHITGLYDMIDEIMEYWNRARKSRLINYYL